MGRQLRGCTPQPHGSAGPKDPTSDRTQSLTCHGLKQVASHGSVRSGLEGKGQSRHQGERE